MEKQPADTAPIKTLSPKSHWNEEGSYYRLTPEYIRQNPLPLPSFKRLSFMKLEQRLQKYLPCAGELNLLEVGCGCSDMLPYFKKKWGYNVAGIDYSEYAASLAKANLEGHGIEGRILCRDLLDVKMNEDLRGSSDIVFSQGVIEHFDNGTEVIGILGNLLEPEGLIVTSVPNLNGINYLAQKFVDSEILDMHVIYSSSSLRTAHEQAGFRTLCCQYSGVYDGWLTEASHCRVPWKKKAHWTFCYVTNNIVDKLTRLSGRRLLPESRFTSPHILYIGTKEHA